MCLCHKVTATTVTSLLKLKDDSLCFSKHHGTELIDQGCTLGSVKFTVPESWRTGKWLLWQTYLDFGMGMCFLTRWVCVWVCGLPRSPPVSALLFSTPATMFQRHSVSCFFNIMNKKCSSWGGSLPPNFLTLHFLSTLSLTWAKLVFFPPLSVALPALLVKTQLSQQTHHISVTLKPLVWALSSRVAT